MKSDLFKQAYWDLNYAEPEIMDGIFNADAHALYLKSFFDVYGMRIQSIADLGAGLGYMSKSLAQVFRPKQMVVVEPSDYAMIQAKKNLKGQANITLVNQMIEQWVKENGEMFDLGACCSVMQYLGEKELRWLIPKLSRQFRFLYLSVPTTYEYSRQKSDLSFEDPHAIHRSKGFYFDLLRPHFKFVSMRLLESKYFFTERSTLVTDFLFRF